MKNNKINFDELFGPVNIPPAIPPRNSLEIQNNNGDGNEKDSGIWLWWLIGTIGLIIIGKTLFVNYQKQKEENSKNL